MSLRLLSPPSLPSSSSSMSVPTWLEASWTMSTPATSSGIFNTTPLEDDDDLRVPSLASDHHHLSTTTTTNNNTNTTDMMMMMMMEKASSATRKRTFSADIRLYVDEDALSRVLSPSLSLTTATTGFDFPSVMSSSASLPSPAIIPDDSSLSCEWMNRSFQSGDFEKVLRNPDVTLLGLSFNNQETGLGSDEEEEMIEEEEVILQQPIPATHLAFESILEFDDLPASPSASAATAAAPSKKRGRPSKEETQPAPKRARTTSAAKATPATPATPRPHPLARPTSDDPEEMAKYLKYRQINNEAACKSRLRRKEREQQSATRVVELEAQNTSLKKELSSLQTEVGRLKALLEAHLRKQK